MIRVNDLLPIGSIVLLKDGEKRLMINGIMQSDASGSGANFDYLGILYPEGHMIMWVVLSLKDILIVTRSFCLITKILRRLFFEATKMRNEWSF